jgi:hypothetical protein
VAEPESVRATVRARYGDAPQRPPLEAAAFDELVAEIRERVRSRTGAPLDALILLTDYPSKAIRIVASPTAVTVNTEDPARPAQLKVHTRSDLIRSTLRSPFGKDLISIGYGAQFHVRSSDDLSGAPHDRLLQLLAPAQPRWRQLVREHPFRTFRYILGDASMRYAMTKRVLRRTRARQAFVEPAPYEIRDWVAVPES